jgi:FMN reductase
VTVAIAGFAGTSNPASSTLAALRLVLDAARAEGATAELFDAGSLALPMYESGAEPSEAVLAFAETMYRADAVVWSSPLYHGTISGIFKNAIDWLEVLSDRDPPYLSDKPVGLVGVAAGAQSLQAITAMEHIVRSLRGWTVPLVVPINRASEVFDKQGIIKDARVASSLAALGAEVVRAAKLFRRTPEAGVTST